MKALYIILTVTGILAALSAVTIAAIMVMEWLKGRKG